MSFVECLGDDDFYPTFGFQKNAYAHTYTHIWLIINLIKFLLLFLYVFCYLNSNNDYVILMRLEKNNFFPLLFHMVILFATDD